MPTAEEAEEQSDIEEDDSEEGGLTELDVIEIIIFINRDST